MIAIVSPQHRSAMMQAPDQILTVAQMVAAEGALIEAGSSVDDLMQIAGRGAAQWVWRMSGGHKVTVLCGPGNNGGDGYVIAEAIRAQGGEVVVVAAVEAGTDAARNARAAFGGTVCDMSAGAGLHGEVLVDCLFGSGLARPLEADHHALLMRLAGQHRHRIAIDVPSGVQSDSGMLLNSELPRYDLTVCLGAWKFAHVLMPASAIIGEMRLVDIGVAPVGGAARMIARPNIAAPAAAAHKYTRGLLAVVGGAMPGASLLACEAAQRAGAGYIRLFSDERPANAPFDLVVDTGHLSDVLTDDRNTAILVGPGLGRNAAARERLAIALADPVPAVLDADALVLLGARQLAEREAPVIATPHEGELHALERAFDCDGAGTKVDRTVQLARVSRMVIVAKGPDTVIAAPDGRIACSARASSWLSTAGTGDVLAGTIASRVATGVPAFEAACEGVWLHGEAARMCSAAFSAAALAKAIPQALATCL